METVNEILEINLLKKYSNERQEKYREGFLNKVKSIDTHPKFKVGQIISFIAGYYDNIRYTTEIIGFNKEGEIYVLWDCFWFGIKDTKERDIFIELSPLAKRPLSSQLYDHTGDHYSDLYFDRAEDTLTHKNTGIRFKMASQESEALYKAQKKWVDNVKQSYLKNKYKDRKEPFIYFHNPDQWRDGLNELKKGGIVEMCEDSFDHFMNCVPPKRFNRASFVCGEPYSHNNKGEGIYLCAIEKQGKYYAQYGTVRQYDNKELFK